MLWKRPQVLYKQEAADDDNVLGEKTMVSYAYEIRDRKYKKIV